jgi:histidinol phosphatase-like PHP family hydrolase
MCNAAEARLLVAGLEVAMAADRQDALLEGDVDVLRVDAGKVIDAAIAHDVVIELNASPWRLDMDWRHWRKAAERGLVCAINPDAHATGEFVYTDCGTTEARRGWLTKADVANTRTWKQLDKLRKKR